MKIVIIGGRRKALFLIQTLKNPKHEIVAITDDIEQGRMIARTYNIDVYVGDASRISLLSEASVQDFDLSITLMPEDSDNLIISQILKRKFHVKRTMSIVANPHHVDVFNQLGVDIALSTTHMVSQYLHELATLNMISEKIEAAAEVVERQHVVKQTDACCGKTIQSLNLPEGILIYCVRDITTIIPNGETILREGSMIYGICLKHMSESFVKQLVYGKA